MVVLAVERHEVEIEVRAHTRHEPFQVFANLIRDCSATVFCREDQMDVQVVNNVPSRAKLVHCILAGLLKTNHVKCMIERKGILIRLYPDVDQDILFRRTGGCVRLVKNVALEQRSMFGRPGRPINYYTQRAELSALKEEASFLREVPHHCLQEALVDLDRAFANFFAGRAKYPTHQRKRDGVSFRFPDPKQFSIEGDTTTPDKKRKRAVRDVVVHLPKAGPVRASMHRAIPPGAVLKSITVRSSGDMWLASLLCEREVGMPEDRSTQAVVGVDLGVCQPAATSTGEIYDLPKTTDRQRERERRLHRKIARKKKRSRNRSRAVKSLARFKAKQARRRLDAREKLTTKLAKNHGVVAMEGIDLRNMTKSARGTVAQPGKNVAQKAGLNRVVRQRARPQ